MGIRVIVACLALGLMVAHIGAAAPLVAPDAAAVQKAMRPGHPRLILTNDALATLRSQVAVDPVAAEYLKRLEERGEATLTQPPVERGPIGPKMLGTSRTALDRITTLALLYHLEGDRKWADRAIAELRAVIAFSDWNPVHFLDVAEMTAAVSFGYDWLYDLLTSEDRAAIRVALAEKGLRPAFPYYAAPPEEDRQGGSWAVRPHNWNLVCNGGMILGALAIADENPALSNEVLRKAFRSLPIALDTYGPDGAWPEGPGYWAYSTEYLLYAAHALQTALGSDYGIMAHPGIRATGYFPRAMIGPSGEAFNFGDAGTSLDPRTQQYGLARWFHDPALAYLARPAGPVTHAEAFDLIWHSPDGSAQDLAKTPRDQHFERVEVATLRSSWTDPNALFIGFKAGAYPGVPPISDVAPGEGFEPVASLMVHSHLDLGSFVLDAEGLRWADDLGGGSYSLPDYFNHPVRGTYYRSGTPGHNTLLLDGKSQSPDILRDHRAKVEITAFQSHDDEAFAIADLADAYAPAGATRLRRGVALLNHRKQVLIQDEIATKEPVEVVWSMHTRATIAVDADGAQATLTREGKTLHVQLLGPAGARLTVEEVVIPPPQRPITGEQKLLIRLPEKTAAARIAVLFTPGAAAAEAPPVIALDEWE